MNLECVYLIHSVQFDNNKSYHYMSAERDKMSLDYNETLRTIEVVNSKKEMIVIPLENVRHFKYGPIPASTPRRATAKGASKANPIEAV